MMHARRFGQLIGGARRPRLLLAAIGVAVSSGVGCSELTSVDALDVVQPSDLDNRTGARALRAGAISRFTGAYVSDFRSQVLVSGLISDEFMATYGGDPYDRRTIPELSSGAASGATFSILSVARARLLQGIAAMQRFDPESRGDIGEWFALLAYVQLFLSENFCSGVPLSSVEDGKPVYGPQLSTTHMLERSIADFDSAIAYSENDMKALNLARVGRGRALLQLGQSAEAASSVIDVPTSFSYYTNHNPAGARNEIWHRLTQERSFTVGDQEGVNGLDFISAQDPRVRTRWIGFGLDGQSPAYVIEKYGDASSPVVLASGIEARLIEAEALLQAHELVGSWSKLNELRGQDPELDPLPMESTEIARVDQLFRERAFWLFGTGHRHGDLRRLIRQYGRESESVFPTGDYREGLKYGTDVTLELPELETNNPQFTGSCFNRNP